MVGFLNKDAKSQVVSAIRQAEKMTSGEIRVHLEARCPGDPYKKALKVFRRLGMHRTKNKNAVLLFLAMDSRKFAIVGDQEIHKRVGETFWNHTRDTLARHFSVGNFKGGIVAGILSIGEKLKAYFPPEKGDANELPNIVTET